MAHSLRRKAVDPSVFVAVLAAAMAPAVQATCEAPQRIFSDGSVIAEATPRLKWQPVAGASAYRVQMQSRVPNGRVIAAHDTVVIANELLPPHALAEHRAKVTVRLAAVCGSETSGQSLFTFVIDTSPMCRLSEVEVALEDGKARLRWEPVLGARSYEVRAYRIVDGRLLAAQETLGAAAEVALPESAVFSVRPACAGGLGDAVYRVVTAD